MPLTQEILKELLHYDPDTGVFTWLHRDLRWFKKERSCRSFNTWAAGMVAGWMSATGYWYIGIFGTKYKAHRLAFLYMIGEFPKNDTDHIDGNRINNRWNNLRDVTRSENLKNQAFRKNNTSGFLGVCWHKGTGKWLAQIKVGGKNFHLGLFEDIGDAVSARHAANIKFGFHINHGRAAKES